MGHRELGIEHAVQWGMGRTMGHGITAIGNWVWDKRQMESLAHAGLVRHVADGKTKLNDYKICFYCRRRT